MWMIIFGNRIQIVHIHKCIPVSYTHLDVYKRQQLSSGIPNSILSGIVYWLIAGTVMAILFVITGWLIIGIGYQVGKIYRKYCWDIISIVVAITSTAVVIYFGEWIKNANPINLIVLLLLSHIIYIGIRCYVKDWMEERGYY